MTATEVMARQNAYIGNPFAQMALRQDQYLALLGQHGSWFGADLASSGFDVAGGDGNLFVARFECATTKDCFELSSLERLAVERGMRHFAYKWQAAISSLREAGLRDDELHVALAFIRPRIAEEARRERDLEEGVRQAEGKARSLLVMCLTPEQREDFEKNNAFTITVDHKVRGFPTGAFRISKGSAFNVSHVESGETFCVVAQEKVPVYDQMLTQKLLLEQEPERFFTTANRSRGWGAGADPFRATYERMIREYMATMYADPDPPQPPPAPPAIRERGNFFADIGRDLRASFGG